MLEILVCIFKSPKYVAYIYISRPPYSSTMGTFPYHSVSQLFLVVLMCMKFHALSVKSNLGKFWSYCILKIFS